MKVNDRELMHELVLDVTVEVEGGRLQRLALAAGLALVRLGAWVMGLGAVRVNPPDAEAEAEAERAAGPRCPLCSGPVFMTGDYCPACDGPKGPPGYVSPIVSHVLATPCPACEVPAGVSCYQSVLGSPKACRARWDAAIPPLPGFAIPEPSPRADAAAGPLPPGEGGSDSLQP